VPRPNGSVWWTIKTRHSIDICQRRLLKRKVPLDEWARENLDFFATLELRLGAAILWMYPTSVVGHEPDLSRRPNDGLCGWLTRCKGSIDAVASVGDRSLRDAALAIRHLCRRPAAERRRRSIEPCHFAGSVAVGFNADTSNSRNALSEEYRLAIRQASAAATQMVATRRDRAMPTARSRISSLNISLILGNRPCVRHACLMGLEGTSGPCLIPRL
jgi:hypothetical protein